MKVTYICLMGPDSITDIHMKLKEKNEKGKILNEFIHEALGKNNKVNSLNYIINLKLGRNQESSQNC